MEFISNWAGLGVIVSLREVASSSLLTIDEHRQQLTDRVASSEYTTGEHLQRLTEIRESSEYTPDEYRPRVTGRGASAGEQSVRETKIS